MESDFTPQESLLVLNEALSLLATPETFTQGTWKCPVYEKPRKGEFLTSPTAKRDEHGRVIYAYCVEGAINQACINALGEPRAVELGALTAKTGEGWDVNPEYMQGGKPTELLSLNQLADKLFHSIIEEKKPDYLGGDEARSAQIVNDCGYQESPSGEVAESAKQTAYERVTKLLKRKRDALRASLGVQG